MLAESALDTPALAHLSHRFALAAAKEHANTAFSVLVILECFVKLIAMGPKLYWRSSWNKFDLLLTVAALVDLITQVRAGSGRWCAQRDRQL